MNIMDGPANFGWISLDLDYRGAGTINAFAFNETPNETIFAGQRTSVSVSDPYTLGLMMMGFGALAFRRKEKVLLKQKGKVNSLTN